MSFVTKDFPVSDIYAYIFCKIIFKFVNFSGHFCVYAFNYRLSSGKLRTVANKLAKTIPLENYFKLVNECEF